MAITNEQSRETGNVGHKRRRKTKQKHNTIRAGHHQAQANTKQITQTRHESPTNNWRKIRTEHRFHVEIVADITIWNLERKKHTI